MIKRTHTTHDDSGKGVAGMLDKKFDATAFPSPEVRDFIYATAQLTYDRFKGHPEAETLVGWFSEWFEITDRFLENERSKAKVALKNEKRDKVDFVCKAMDLSRKDLKDYLDSLDPEELSSEEIELKSLLSGE